MFDMLIIDNPDLIHNPRYNWTWIYNAKHDTNITKLNEKLERNSMHLSCCLCMLIYLVSKDERMHHFGSYLFFIQLGRSVLISPVAKNWEQRMFYPMFCKVHFYVLNSLTDKLGQILELMPHHKIAQHWFFHFSHLLSVCKVWYWLNLPHEGSIVFLY